MHCQGSSAINQEGISCLKLIELQACGNSKIYDVNHMKYTLKILECYGACGINQEGISQLKLEHIKFCDNKKINNIDHMLDTLKFIECYSTDVKIKFKNEIYF